MDNKNVMYIDCYRVLDNIKINVYCNGKMYVLSHNLHCDTNHSLSIIKSIYEKENAIIYVDTNGYGIYIYDDLLQDRNLDVRKLEIDTTFRQLG